MIRKILVVTAAFAMPVAALTAVTTVASSGVAFAKGGTPEAMTCAQGGTVDFAKPGLTYPGTLTAKSTSEVKATVTGTGDAAPCGTKAIKLKIVSPTTPCSQMSPTPAPVCSTGDVAKDPNYYDSAAGFASGSTLTDLATALAAGIKTTDNGTKVTLTFVSDAISSACTAGLGFEIKGNVNDASGPTGLTYTDNVCLVTDTGPGTTGAFETDLFADGSSGPANSTIQTAGIAGGSSLVVSS